MSSKPSARLLAVVNALPIRPGMRVLEIGCGPGVVAREIVRHWPGVYVLGIDRSQKAISRALAGSSEEIRRGALSFRVAAAEHFVLEPRELPFHLAFAVRVGALDGRDPAAGELVLRRIAKVLAKGGRLFVDGGTPLRELTLGAV